MSLRLRVLLVTSLVLSACVNLPPAPAGKPGTLVVYQPLSSDSDARLPFIYVDGYNLGRMGIGDEKTVALEPGEHRVALREPLLLWPGQESAVTHITVEAGKTSYVRFVRKQVGVNANASAITLPSLNEAAPDQGEARQ